MNTQNAKSASDHVTDALNLLAERYNYNHWIYDNIRSFIGNTILEVGAGIGNITDFLMNKPDLTLIDNQEDLVAHLKEKYFFRTEEHCRKYCVDIEKIADSPLGGTQYDTIICLNVLEHIEDDKNAFNNMVSLLAPHGKLILLLPALPWLHGSMDQMYGHIRRYSKIMLQTLAADQNVSIAHMRYMNFVGVFGWYFYGKIIKQSLLPSKQTVLFDKLVPLFSTIEKIIHPPIGQSILCVIEKQ